MSAHRLEDRVNALSDQDWAWWPLLALRPPRNEALSEARLLVIALVFGGLCAAFAVVLLYLLFGEPLLIASASIAALTFTLFYVAARFTLFRCWNRRAARLRAAPAGH